MKNITFDNVSFKYIEKKLLDQASFSITDSDKCAIIGVNGTGKSTILKLINGIEKPISGSITISGGTRINYLEQNPVFDTSISLFDIIMKDSTIDNPIKDFEVNSILSKCGFPDSSITTKNMSGGELKRVALAKVLVTPCDFLLLDEPTNHMDNQLIDFLEKFLIKFKHGLIMVTHDRYFLERVCNKMIELDFGKTYTYNANYSEFLTLKEERLEKERLYQDKLKKILKKEAEWMGRGVEARRTKAKYRIEKFNELSKIEFNKRDDFNLESKDTYLGKKLISIEDGSKAFGDKVLFNNLYFELQRQDIVGIVGDNGAGKSTLFKIIMGEEKLDNGTLSLGETLNIGYFSQHLELIDPEIRVIDYIKEESNIIETLDGKIDAKSLLERFLFDSSIQYSKVKMLSGGEKRRLQLVRTLIKNPNILLFDEPTNDLDVYTLEVLEDYLLSFKGPIMVISHDRYFLDKICNKLLVFDNGSVFETLETFSEYLENTGFKPQNNNAFKNEKEKSWKKPSMPSKLKNELKAIEEALPKLEEELEQLKIDVNTPTSNYEHLIEVQEQLDKKNEEYETKMARYFELLEIKESYDKN